MHTLKCKEHFERTLVRPVGRSAGLREVNEREYLKNKINYPQMNTDKGVLSFYISVFICVHLWTKIVFKLRSFAEEIILLL